jgi:apolipoprotein D and lipocalin family protein
VSFFKPIWASYNVIDIDEDYKYALVVGNNTNYLWILSREKTIPDSYKERFLAKAKSLGFKTENLIWVKHTEKD